MKKTLITAVATLLLVAPLTFVSADNATTSTSTKGRFGERWQEKKEQFEVRKAEFEAKKAEFKANGAAMKDEWAEKRAEKILNIITRVGERFQRAIDRMENITDRVQARIDVLEDDGEDLDVAQDKLDDAKEKINAAQDALNDIDFDDAISTSTGSTSTPAMIFKDLREEFVAVKSLLKEAHAFIAESISAIKESSDEDDN